jgi:hypothetical protein
MASCFLIGCFANFAGNSYGYPLANFAAAAYLLVLIIQGISELRRLKLSRMKSLILLSEYWLVAMGLAGILMKFLHFRGAALFIILGFPIISLFYLSRSMLLLFSLLRKENRYAHLEAMMVRLFCTAGFFGVLCKFQHWPLPNIILITYALGPVVLLIRAIRWLPAFKKLRAKQAYQPYSPSNKYFIIFLVMAIHWFGWKAGWLPGFKQLEMPRTLFVLKEQPDSREQDYRLFVYDHNLILFYEKQAAREGRNPKPDKEDFILEVSRK